MAKLQEYRYHFCSLKYHPCTFRLSVCVNMYVHTHLLYIAFHKCTKYTLDHNYFHACGYFGSYLTRSADQSLIDNEYNFIVIVRPHEVICYGTSSCGGSFEVVSLSNCCTHGIGPVGFSFQTGEYEGCKLIVYLSTVSLCMYFIYMVYSFFLLFFPLSVACMIV